MPAVRAGLAVTPRRLVHHRVGLAVTPCAGPEESERAAIIALAPERVVANREETGS